MSRFDDPDEWAVTWRAYLRKTGQDERLRHGPPSGWD